MSINTIAIAPTINDVIMKLNEVIDALNNGGGGGVSPLPYTSNPAMDGTASAGSSDAYARGDHVHPSDTTRVPTTRTVNSKALSSDITLDAGDVGAVPLKTNTPTSMNDLINTGIYYYTSSTTNHPGSTNGTVIVFRTSSNYIYQMAFSNNSSGNPTIYVRMKYSSSNWSSWKSITVS